MVARGLVQKARDAIKVAVSVSTPVKSSATMHVFQVMTVNVRSQITSLILQTVPAQALAHPVSDVKNVVKVKIVRLDVSVTHCSTRMIKPTVAVKVPAQVA